MLIDVAALQNGIEKAYLGKKISIELHRDLKDSIKCIVKVGSNSRLQCDYAELLKCLSTLDQYTWSELAGLWQYLGASIASGLIVASKAEIQGI